MTPEQLVSMAKEAMTHAYAPYSGYQVGAALLCADGSVYCGCNIENASYTPTVCAERTAFFKAVYDGHREPPGFRSKYHLPKPILSQSIPYREGPVH